MKKKTLLLIIGGIMLLGGIVATGMSAIILYLFLSISPDDLISNLFCIIALIVSLVQLVNGFLTMIKSDKEFSAKPFFITDVAIAVLSVVLIFILGKALPTLLLTGIIVPVLHIIIVKFTCKAAT